MSRRVGITILLFVGLGLTGASVAARAHGACPFGACDSARVPDGSDYIGTIDPETGALVVDLADSASDADRAEVGDELAAAIAPFSWPVGAAGLGSPMEEDAQIYEIDVPRSEVADVLRALGADPEVETVEVEHRWSVPERTDAGAIARPDPFAVAPRDGGDRFVPNDPYYAHQWHLDQIGMPSAWSRGRGDGVVVAVIDTGVAYRNGGGFAQAPDLAETSFVDGWDFVANDAFPDDEHGHGTHVAGTIAQSTDNGVGVAGVAPGASIMPLRVLDASGAGGWAAIASAIRWAADHGADVINMSLGGGMRSRTVERAIDYAYEHGVVIVAAAGNSSNSAVEYPARHDHVIAVGAVRFDRELSFYSCYGDGLDVVAPGGDTRVDQNGDGLPDGVLQNTIVGRDVRRFDYLAWQGTSMAAPHVAGVAALIRSSGVTDPDAVERVLEETAEPVGDELHFGSGLVRADGALARTEDTDGGLRGLAALALGALVLGGLRRRGKLGVAPVAATLIAFAVAGGLAVLPFSAIGLGVVEPWLAGGVPGTLAHLGSFAHVGVLAATVALTALIPLGGVLFFLQNKRMLPLIVGVSLGFAAYLLVEAMVPTARLALPLLVTGPWLLAQAGASLWLARQAALKSS
jgi:serine protease